MKTSPTKFIHSRAAAIILVIVAVCAALARLPLPAPGETALSLFPEPDTWLPQGTASFVLNMTVNAAIAFMLLVINRVYRLMRTITWAFVGLFFFMQLAQPGALGYFYGGSFLALTALTLTALLFSTFADPACTRSTYLLFMLLALAALFQYNVIFLLPVFLLGIVQMKTFDTRTMLACFMGLVTPLWIFIGFGIVSPDALFPIPFLDGAGPVAAESDHAVYITRLLTTAFTGGLGLIFTFVNFIKVMSYNSARRAFNGFFTLLFLATIVLIVADYGNHPLYIPLLDILAAYQAGHFFATRRYRLSYIPVCIILCIYAAIAAIPVLL